MTRWFVSTVVAMAIATSGTTFGAVVLLDSTGDPSTGDNLDGIGEATAGIAVPELPGLSISVNSLGGTGSVVVNSTGTGLGLNSEGDDDTDAFDSDFNESLELEFDQDVTVTLLDLTNFEDGDVFEFAGQTISVVDNGTTDEVSFDPGFTISAGTPFLITASVGTVGIESITMTAATVPEPGGLAMLSCGMLGLLRMRRRTVVRS